MSTLEQSLTVGEAAERVGLTTYTLRWYEQEGLVAPVGRDSSGRRRYTESDVNWLLLLTRLRRTGMPVRDMRRYAELGALTRQAVSSYILDVRSGTFPGPDETFAR